MKQKVSILSLNLFPDRTMSDDPSYLLVHTEKERKGRIEIKEKLK